MCYLRLYGTGHNYGIGSFRQQERKFMGYYGIFYMHNPIDKIEHTKAFVKSVVEYWLEGEIAQWV